MCRSTPKSGRHSVFFHDLSTPVSARRGGRKFKTLDQSAAVSALQSENFSDSYSPPSPPPPIFTLADRPCFSPQSGIQSDARTPVQSSGREFSTPKSNSDVSTSYPVMGGRQRNQQDSVASGGSSEQDDKGQGSLVKGVLLPWALITIPPPEEVARPAMQNNSLAVGYHDGEEWVTVYGFSPGDANLVLREFEKCGVVLKHVLGPRNANWMHLLYQFGSDAQKALNKNGMEINRVVIIGVKPVDPIQRQTLNESLNNQGFMTLPPAPSSQSLESHPFRASSYPCYPPYPCYLQNSSNITRQSAGTIATLAKSMASKIMDLMFGF